MRFQVQYMFFFDKSYHKKIKGKGRNKRLTIAMTDTAQKQASPRCETRLTRLSPTPYQHCRQNCCMRMLYLRRGSLLLDGSVSGLRLVLRAAGEDDELGAVLLQASNVGRERLLLSNDTF